MPVTGPSDVPIQTSLRPKASVPVTKPAVSEVLNPANEVDGFVGIIIVLIVATVFVVGLYLAVPRRLNHPDEDSE